MFGLVEKKELDKANEFIEHLKNELAETRYALFLEKRDKMLLFDKVIKYPEVSALISSIFNDAPVIISCNLLGTQITIERFYDKS